MDKPFAITLDVGSSLANKTGSWRTSRPVYLDRLPPCNHACPAGENIQALAVPRRRRATTKPRGARSPRTTRCRRSWAGSATTRARARATAGQLDEAVGINSVERFLGDEAIKRGWKFTPPEDRERQARARRRRRPLRAVRRLPPAPTRPLRDDRRGRPARRRHDALRHSEVPAAARGSRRRGTAHPRSGGRDRVLNTKVDEHPRHHARRALRRRLSRRRRAHRQARLHPGRGSGAHARRGVGAARHGGRGEADAGPPGRRLRRRQHRARRRAHRQAPRRDRGDHRLPAHAREDAGARLRSRGGAAGRRADHVAVDDPATWPTRAR